MLEYVRVVAELRDELGLAARRGDDPKPLGAVLGEDDHAVVSPARPTRLHAGFSHDLGDTSAHGHFLHRSLREEPNPCPVRREKRVARLVAPAYRFQPISAKFADVEHRVVFLFRDKSEPGRVGRERERR